MFILHTSLTTQRGHQERSVWVGGKIPESKRCEGQIIQEGAEREKVSRLTERAPGFVCVGLARPEFNL